MLPCCCITGWTHFFIDLGVGGDENDKDHLSTQNSLEMSLVLDCICGKGTFRSRLAH